MITASPDFVRQIDERLRALEAERAHLVALRDFYAGSTPPLPAPPLAPQAAARVAIEQTYFAPRFPAIPIEQRVKLIADGTGGKGMTQLILKVVRDHPGLANAVLVRRIQDYIHPDTPIQRDNLRKQLRYMRGRGKLRRDEQGGYHVVETEDEGQLGIGE